MIRKLFQGGETEPESKKRRIWIEQLNRDILTFQMKVLIDEGRTDMVGLFIAIDKYVKTLPESMSRRATINCYFEFCLLVAESDKSFSMWKDALGEGIMKDRGKSFLARVLENREYTDIGPIIRWIRYIYHQFNWGHFKDLIIWCDMIFGSDKVLDSTLLQIIKHANWEECTVSDFAGEVNWLVEHFRETAPAVADAIKEQYRLQTERTPFQEMIFQMNKILRGTETDAGAFGAMDRVNLIIIQYHIAMFGPYFGVVDAVSSIENEHNENSKLTREEHDSLLSTLGDGWFEFCALVAKQHTTLPELLGLVTPRGCEWVYIILSGQAGPPARRTPVRHASYEIDLNTYIWGDVLMPRLLTMENVSNGVLEYWATFGQSHWRGFSALVDKYSDAPVAAWYEMLEALVYDKNDNDTEKYILHILEVFKKERFLLDRIIKKAEDVMTPAISKWKNGVPRMYSNVLGRDVSFNFQS